MTDVSVFAAYVTTPSGKRELPKIEDNKDGTVTIKYQPTEAGLHELAVLYNNTPIQGQLQLTIQNSNLIFTAGIIYSFHIQ